MSTTTATLPACESDTEEVEVTVCVGCDRPVAEDDGRACSYDSSDIRCEDCQSTHAEHCTDCNEMDIATYDASWE